MPDIRLSDSRVPGGFMMEFSTETEQREYQFGRDEKFKYVEPHVSFINENEKVKYNLCEVLYENCELWEEEFKPGKYFRELPLTHDDYENFRHSKILTVELKQGQRVIGTTFYVFPVVNHDDPSDDFEYVLIGSDITEGNKYHFGCAYSRTASNKGAAKCAFILNGDFELDETIYAETPEGNEIIVKEGEWFDVKCLENIK